MFLIDVVKCLDKAKIKYALVGGYALALQGIVRATVDVDLVIQINKSQLNLIEKAMTTIGLKISVVSLKDLLKMKIKSNRPKDQLDVESIRASLKNEK